ncbi:MAG TPA: protease complex subunit PrcB family protein [Thermoanaerobaculia bacterium]|nr:protease complex subunit PrcB family protein [Thermoanaerobaculia bacterium]
MRVAILLSLLTLFGCATDTIGGNLEMRTLTTGQYAAAQPDGPTAVAVRSEEEYARIWQEQVGSGQPPAVDFAKESVVILLAGMKRSGGYTIEPVGVKLEGRTLVVDATVTSPPSGGIVTMALTSPFAVIAVNAKNFDEVRWTP